MKSRASQESPILEVEILLIETALGNGTLILSHPFPILVYSEIVLKSGPL